MLAAVVAVAVVAAPSGVTVSHRRVDVGSASLALYRYQPPAQGEGHGAVLLIPEVGFTRAVFDFEDRGLARWLSQRGLAVYVAELRGQGRSVGPGGFEAWVREDLPRLVAIIQQEHPGPVDLVVQGWSGAVALSATAVELKGQVRRVVALNTPAVFEVPSRAAERFLQGGGRFSALSADPGGRQIFVDLFALATRMPTGRVDALRREAVRDLPAGQAASLLAWMRAGDLPLGEGSSVASRLSAYDRPTLVLLGLADNFAPPELCAPLKERSRAPVRQVTFTRFEDDEDYAHLSMLLGRRAERDVAQRIADFLLEAP